MSTETAIEATTSGRISDFIKITERRDELRENLAFVEKERAAIELELVEHYALNGIQSCKVNGVNVYLQRDQHVTVKPECKDAALAAARELELEDLISLQPARFAAWAREQLRDEATGNALPSEFVELVNVYEKASLRMRRS